MRTIKLLLVDDERLTREGLRESLVRDIPEIDEVLEAGDGQEALDLAVAQAPEIILTDVRMPHMDGVTFASKIHALAPAASIIFMSGYSDKEYLQAAIRVRAVSYVEKPVSISEVEDAVREAMAYHEQMNRSLRYTSLQHREKEAQLSLLLAGADEGRSAAAAALMADYIRRNYRQDTLSVRDISSCAGLSTAYACTVFKAKTGKTMNQYLTDYRIEKAKHLLEDPRIRISEISSQVGYLDGNYFGKSFKKVTGLTPSEYREKLLS